MQKIKFFNDIKLVLPDDFETSYYDEINELFGKLKGESYSIDKIRRF